ncbi:heavy-metal-associated domain-containing protein [Desertihabitans brevis]|uniref:Heavy-metal-associated domain-containing protein n=1 Tax=Desertihabitans brevis TaxID=2268447 RepID=A0A367YS72_9ACTN|nr:heavy metal-associated domain-containing protein [Desertihabitans brevis]RCK68736.1 heavy-metal-associated domain-containing protein [Desertihabitans brevis]
MTTQTYLVSGMSCGHCETAVRSELGAVPGVQQVEVSAATGRLTVTTDGSVDDATVIAAVDEAGYQAQRG